MFQMECKKKFFKNLPLFHYVSENELNMLSDVSNYRRYPTNTLVLRQDDFPESIYFIKAGRIKVLKKVDFKIPSNVKEANKIEFLIQDPVLRDYEEKKVESKLLEIDELTNGDSFAEYAAILKEQIQYSVITCMPSEVITVDIDDFKKLGKNFAEAIIKFSKVIPED